MGISLRKSLFVVLVSTLGCASPLSVAHAVPPAVHDHTTRPLTRYLSELLARADKRYQLPQEVHSLAARILSRVQALGKKRVTAKLLLNELKSAHLYSSEHSLRVGRVAKQIALELGFSRFRAAAVERYGVLHDLGKLLISQEVLDKPGKLSSSEYEQIQQHSGYGSSIIKALLKQSHPKNQLAAEISLFHHERPDGAGYPTKSEWENIPLEAKIIAVADVYDAMTSQRSYNVPKTKSQALEVIKAISGAQLDREVVDALLRAADKLPEPGDMINHGYGAARLH